MKRLVVIALEEACIRTHWFWHGPIWLRHTDARRKTCPLAHAAFVLEERWSIDR